MALKLRATLYLATDDTSVSLDGDSLKVDTVDRMPGTPRTRFPLVDIDTVMAFGNTHLTQHAMLRCADEGITVAWMTSFGKFRAILTPPDNPRIHLRLAQYEHATTPARCIPIARSMIDGKIRNTQQHLTSASRDATGTRKAHLERAGSEIEMTRVRLAEFDTLPALMGAEGNAARIAFETWQYLLTSHATIVAPKTRTRQPATDPLNGALNFGYGLLRTSVHGALQSEGLDPYLGFLHQPRSGKPALSLDMMEEFRPSVDRFVRTLFNRQQLTAKHFETTISGAVSLNKSGKQVFFSEFSNLRRTPTTHKELLEPIMFGLLPNFQARILARTLRDNLDTYHPWIAPS